MANLFRFNGVLFWLCVYVRSVVHKRVLSKMRLNICASEVNQRSTKIVDHPFSSWGERDAIDHILRRCHTCIHTQIQTRPDCLLERVASHVQRWCKLGLVHEERQ